MRKTEYRISSPANVSCTIALVTDLHEQEPTEVLGILREAKPDVICVVGDLLERCDHGGNAEEANCGLFTRLLWQGYHLLQQWHHFQYGGNGDKKPEYAYQFLREVGAMAPVLVSRGNHELYLTDEDDTRMAQAGAVLLDNDWVEVKGILFGGLTSRHVSGTLDTAFLQSFSSQAGYKVLLSHHPEDYEALAPYPMDLILSGHCHGGQIRFLGRGIFAPGQGFLPKYHHGVYHNKLVVSAGCANTTFIPRWGNETEVVIVQLTAQSSERKKG